MDGTILGQGQFFANTSGLANPTPGVASVSSGNPVIIPVPSGVDWIAVRNFTRRGQAGVAAPGSLGFEFFWQRGMPAGSAMASYKQAPGNASAEDNILSGGFTLYDPSGQTAGAQALLSSAVAVTTNGGTNAVRPVVVTANTAGLAVGSVVRLSGTLQSSLNGVDFVVGAVVPGTSFTLLTASNALANIPGAGAAAQGFYRIVNVDSLFYPRRRFVTNITQAQFAQVSTSMEHSMTVGQEIRFNIPAVSGMTQLNPDPLNNYFPRGTSAPVIVVSIVDPYNFTINVDTTTFTAFTFPTIAQQPSSFPLFAPVGEDTATALAANNNLFPQYQGSNIYNANSGILADSTVNTGFLGMILGTGAAGVQLTTAISGPAGSISWSAANVATPDQMFWIAGKSTYGGL